MPRQGALNVSVGILLEKITKDEDMPWLWVAPSPGLNEKGERRKPAKGRCSAFVP